MDRDKTKAVVDHLRCYDLSTMKRGIVLVVLAIALPLIAREGRMDLNNNSGSAQQATASSQKLDASSEHSSLQNETAVDHPRSYIARLLYPDNLPSIALFIVGVVGTVVAIRSLNAIERQAKANEDTLAEVKAAGQQTAELLKHTAAQTADLHAAAKAAEKSAEAAETRIKLAAKHLELTERPWISPAVTVISPLTYDEEGARVTLKIDLDNVGKSPAIGIWIDPRMHLLSPARVHPLEERNRICHEIIERKPDWGSIVFPGRRVTWQYSINALASDIEKSRREIVPDADGDPPFPFYSMSIILAVAYRTTLDESARYYTGMVYDLTRCELTRPPNERYGLRIGESVPIEFLSLTMHPVGGIVAV